VQTSVAHEDPGCPAVGALDDNQAAARVDSSYDTSVDLPLSKVVLSAAVIVE
jgi:hypothetical protein